MEYSITDSSAVVNTLPAETLIVALGATVDANLAVPVQETNYQVCVSVLYQVLDASGNEIRRFTGNIPVGNVSPNKIDPKTIVDTDVQNAITALNNAVVQQLNIPVTVAQSQNISPGQNIV